MSVLKEHLNKWLDDNYYPLVNTNKELQKEIQRLSVENERIKEENQILANMTINYNKQENPKKMLKLQEKIKEQQEEIRKLSSDRARYREQAQRLHQKCKKWR